MRLRVLGLLLLAVGCGRDRITAVGRDQGAPPAPAPAVPPAARLPRLTVQLTGDGTVTAAQAPLSCPGNCVVSLPSGSMVALTAHPAPGVTFAGFSGGCTGGASCTLAVFDDVTVFARFERPGCAGVLPAALDAPVSRTIGHSAGLFCENATSDEEGNVAGSTGGAGPGAWSLWAADGRSRGQIAGAPRLLAQRSGYQGVSGTALEAWTADGTPSRRTELGAHPAGAVFTQDVAFPAVTGGSVVLTETCWNAQQSDLYVSRFDANGALLSKVNIGGAGCAGHATAVSDALDRTLVVAPSDGTPRFGIAADRAAARWLDRGGAPLTDWFDAGGALSNGPGLRPLIGGGVAIYYQLQWTEMIPSGQAIIAPAPGFLRDGFDLAIVHGGKAYALVPPQGSSLELFSAAGDACGTLPLPAAAKARLQLGLDGTVMALSGPDGCSIDWWVKLLE